MECKNCKQQLEQGVTLCPACGTENAAEAPKGIVLTPGKLVAVIAAVVLLTAAVVALIMTGMGFSFDKPVETEPVTPPSEEVTLAEPTIPAAGNPDDVTCKGSYTVSDEEIAADMANIVATVGDRNLTNAELQIYYWMEVQNFLMGDYGPYLSMLGFDYTQPLDTQTCGFSDTPMTWQQYFLSGALADWQNHAALAEEAEANGYEMDQEYLDMIAALPESLATEAGVKGFDSAEEYLAYNVGMGASIADYQSYMTTYYEGFTFFRSQYDAMIPTDAELEEYFAAHEEEYAANGITRDTKLVDIRHILVLPEGADLNTIRTETFPEEAWAAGEKEAQKILDEWLAGDKTEESFAAAANQYSLDPGSNTNGGLYTDVTTGEMVEAFDAWCFDPSRQVGDYGIVRTELGFHIMYFSGSNPVWMDEVRSEIMNQRGADLINTAADKYPMTVDYSAITLGFVDMNK